MGKNKFSLLSYSSARSFYEIGDVGTKGTTEKAEQKAYSSGKLEMLVDPAEYGVIRLSLPRFVKSKEHQKLSVGPPMPIETRVDTTGSMGDNVDIALDVLPKAFEGWSEVLPGYDIQVATGIFGDVRDRFPLCRPQFEMEASKIVGQLAMMVPEKQGGDAPEDPDIGIFGGAYLVRSYINRIGLKRYDFTVTDAPGRGHVYEDQLKRVFGENVFDKVRENGHSLNFKQEMDLQDIWVDLLKQAHAFVLLVDYNRSAKQFWEEIVGKTRVIQLPSTYLLPQVQSVIIGITEGTLNIKEVPKFLKKFNVNKSEIDMICESVVDLPFGLQQKCENYSKLPQKNDLFKEKPDVWEDTNLWPFGNEEEEDIEKNEHDDDEDDWK